MDNVLVEYCPACLSPDLLPFLSVPDFRATKEVFELYRCPQCGFVVTQDHPGASVIDRYYLTEDYISHSDSATTLMDRMYYLVRKWMVRRKRQLIEKFVHDRTLIDVGAGTGFFLAHMQAHGWKVRGLEPGATARKVALRLHGLELEEPGSLFELPSHSTSCITMWHVLEHVHDPEKYLDHIHRVLKDDGVLLLALPNYRSLDQRFYRSYWGAWDVPRHLWHFSPHSVNTMLTRLGFYLVEHRAMAFDSFYVALISEKYRGGGMLRLMRGFVIGKLSFFNAVLNRNRASSLIYVLKKISA